MRTLDENLEMKWCNYDLEQKKIGSLYCRPSPHPYKFWFLFKILKDFYSKNNLKRLYKFMNNIAKFESIWKFVKQIAKFKDIFPSITTTTIASFGCLYNRYIVSFDPEFFHLLLSYHSNLTNLTIFIIIARFWRLNWHVLLLKN